MRAPPCASSHAGASTDVHTHTQSLGAVAEPAVYPPSRADPSDVVGLVHPSL